MNSAEGLLCHHVPAREGAPCAQAVGGLVASWTVTLLTATFYCLFLLPDLVV